MKKSTYETAVQRTRILRRLGLRGIEPEKATLIGWGAAFRGRRGIEKIPPSTLPSSDVELIKIVYGKNARHRVINRREKGFSITTIEIPFTQFERDFPLKPDAWVREQPLFIDLHQVIGKNAKKVKSLLFDANKQSVKMAVERMLFKNPGKRTTTPLELTDLLIREMIPISVRASYGKLIRKSTVRQMANNVEEVLVKAGFAKPLNPIQERFVSTNQFIISGEIKPKEHSLISLKGTLNLYFGAGAFRGQRLKRLTKEFILGTIRRKRYEKEQLKK